MKSLYAIKDEYLQALDELPGLDLPDDVVNDTLEGLKGTFEDKAVNVAAYIKNLEADSNAIADALSGLSIRRKAVENKIEKLKVYLKDSMSACDIKKVHNPLLDIIIKNNPHKVKILDEGIIPNEFIKVTKIESIDKVSIKDWLKKGSIIPGCILVQEQSLIIK